MVFVIAMEGRAKATAAKTVVGHLYAVMACAAPAPKTAEIAHEIAAHAPLFVVTTFVKGAKPVILVQTVAPVSLRLFPRPQMVLVFAVTPPAITARLVQVAGEIVGIAPHSVAMAVAPEGKPVATVPRTAAVVVSPVGMEHVAASRAVFPVPTIAGNASWVSEAGFRYLAGGCLPERGQVRRSIHPYQGQRVPNLPASPIYWRVIALIHPTALGLP